MTGRATVLYEDQKDKKGGFALHDFIVRCATDDCNVGDARFGLEHNVIDQQLKGNGKLLNAVLYEAEAIGHGDKLIAVFDNDRVRELLNLSPDASEDDVKGAIIAKATHEYPLNIFLLVENMETVVEATVRCAEELGAPIDRETQELALERKDLNAREVVLLRAVRVAAKALRDCIRQRVPSLGPLISSLTETLNPT